MTALQPCRNPACDRLLFTWDRYWCSPICALTREPSDPNDPATDLGDYDVLPEPQPAVTHTAEPVDLPCGCHDWEHELYDGECPQPYDPTPRPGWLTRVLRRLLG